MKLFAQYSGVRSVFNRYWQHYGGRQAVFLSPYFHAAIVLTACLYPYWLTQPWWNLAINGVPGLLGFSLGGFAIWLGFGDRDFRDRIGKRKKGEASSAYMKVSSAFAHFIVLQISALIAAIIAAATQFSISTDGPIGRYVPLIVADFFVTYLAPMGYFFGFLLFCYALLSALAAGMAVFRVASWFDYHINDGQSKEDGNKQK